jgi:phage tail-like protein
VPEKKQRKPDPYAVFNFVVEINNITVGGFSEVTGLQAETEYETIREGGVNDYEHKLARITKYPNLTLKRGILDADELWRWHEQVVDGTVERNTITIKLQDIQKEDKWTLVFNDAYPVKWSVSDLNATSGTIALETVEFAHNGMKRGK